LRGSPHLAAAACLLISGVAWASDAGHGDGHGADDAGLGGVLVILGMVGVAYLIAHFFVDWVQNRFLVVSGLEYVLLGALLGPAVLVEVNVFKDLTALAPIIAFAAGWVGLLYGMQFERTSLMAVSDRSIRLGVADALGTAITVTTGAWFLFESGLLGVPFSGNEAKVAAAAMGCAAAAGSTSAVDLLRLRYPGLETNLLDLLGRSAKTGDVIAIIAFGLIFCFFHEGTVRLGQVPDETDWLVTTVVLGGVLGILFTAFLGGESDENTRFLALTGIIIFASGAAFFLNLSALLLNLILGAFIVNGRSGEGVYNTLIGTMRPIRLILLVFAGALWTPVDPTLAVILAAAYILVRLVSKMVSDWAASLGNPLRSDIFRGLMAQGDVAIAMAISFQIVYDGELIDLAYTAILISIVIHEFIAPRILKGLLVDAGELRQDVEPVHPQSEAAAGG